MSLVKLFIVGIIIIIPTFVVWSLFYNPGLLGDDLFGYLIDACMLGFSADQCTDLILLYRE